MYLPMRQTADYPDRVRAKVSLTTTTGSLDARSLSVNSLPDFNGIPRASKYPSLSCVIVCPIGSCPGHYDANKCLWMSVLFPDLAFAGHLPTPIAFER